MSQRPIRRVRWPAAALWHFFVVLGIAGCAAGEPESDAAARATPNDDAPSAAGYLFTYSEVLPPISVVLAAQRDSYIEGLSRYREDDLGSWLEHFAAATARSARLATAYLDAVRGLMDSWREHLTTARAPRADAAAWAVIDVLPAYPIITAPVAAAATGRAKSAIHQAIGSLEEAGVLLSLSESKRNRSWEATGLLSLLASLEAGELPTC